MLIIGLIIGTLVGSIFGFIVFTFCNVVKMNDEYAMRYSKEKEREQDDTTESG